MANELSGKVALITGGAIGIGREIALQLARNGADIAISWHSHAEEGAEAVRQIEALGRKASGFALDAMVSDDVTRAVDDVVAAFGGIDILVNNSGGLIARQEIETMSDAHWQRVISLNLDSAFYCTRAAIRHMRQGGRIVNVSSLAGHNGGSAGSIAYAAAKSGMFGFTRGLAKELAPRQITVNAVAPGLILDTPFHETFTPKDAQAVAISGIPLRRAGYPNDVASAVTWLCSPGAAWITGEVVNINGGQYFP
jgi:3-oxoacyl-[acyl-carrier protein] reductase